MQRVRYDRERHLDEMMAIASRQLATHGPTSGLHPGDVAHRIQNQLRRHHDVEVVHVWIKGDSVVGFGILWPDWAAFDLGIEPTASESDVRTVVEELIVLATDSGRVETEVYCGDARLARIVASYGFTKTTEPFVITSQDLKGERQITLSGYSIRGARLEEAASISAAHVSAFSSSWTADSYRAYMETPPYRPEHEIVAVAPDGTIAGFAVVWLDRVNAVGYFEPVGTHKDHQRRGVGSAVLAGGMNMMLRNGMTRASVMHDADSPNNAGFYRSCGFRRIGTIHRWVRETTDHGRDVPA